MDTLCLLRTFTLDISLFGLILAVFIITNNSLSFNKLLSIFYNDGISSKPSNLSKIEHEVNRVIDNNFSLFVEDYKRLETLELKMKHAQESRIIKLLQTIGLIKWF